jgi:mRNA interferase HigB
MKYNHVMRIISQTRIKDFALEHADAREPLDRWYQIMSSKTDHLTNFMELKKVFGNQVDVVKKGYVFNIGANKYRLAASIHFNKQKVFIREIMTHAQYSKEDWKHRHQDFH